CRVPVPRRLDPWGRPRRPRGARLRTDHARGRLHVRGHENGRHLHQHHDRVGLLGAPRRGDPVLISRSGTPAPGPPRRWWNRTVTAETARTATPVASGPAP